jgi:hypothetical protein
VVREEARYDRRMDRGAKPWATVGKSDVVSRHETLLHVGAHTVACAVGMGTLGASFAGSNGTLVGALAGVALGVGLPLLHERAP